MAAITIGNRKIGDGFHTYIIAEMSANHAGSIRRAKDIIYAAKEAGADCIKIQTYTPDTITIDCNNKYFSIKDGLWKGENLYSLYGKAYTPWEWQEELKQEAERIGIDFFSTPFDKTAVDFLEGIGIGFYKIASFELVDIPLIEYTASKGKPMILSTGMATIDEIDDAVRAMESQGNSQYAFLKCSSAYPAVSSDMNLNTIIDMKERFQVPIGLSDHSMGSVGAMTAVALGANIIEKHFCISREIENPDAAFSMTKDEFRQMVGDIRSVEMAKGCVKYGACEQEKESLIFRKSIFAIKNIKAGEKLSNENVRVIRPGYGIKPKNYKDIIGKTALVDVEYGNPIRRNMFEQWLQKSLEEAEADVVILTNNDNAISLYEGLKDLNMNVIAYDGKVDLSILKNINPKLIVSYNYKHIIENDVVSEFDGRIVNLHTSLLPWNRGSNPNLWSFIDETPKGITIHHINSELDKGDIIVQREMTFDESKETLRTTYDMLNYEIVKLFLDNFHDIYNGNAMRKTQNGKGSYHSAKQFFELNKIMKIDWDEKICDFKARLREKYYEVND